MRPLLTPREVDQLLRYPRGRSMRLAKAGRLSAIFLPDGEIRFDPDDIEALGQSNRASAGNAPQSTSTMSNQALSDDDKATPSAVTPPLALRPKGTAGEACGATTGKGAA